MRICDTIRGREVEDRRKEEEMTTPITLPQLDELTLTELRRRYKETTDAETRTRYQMLLLSLRGQTSSKIAQMVLRSQDTVVRVLKRFLTGGLDAVPRRTAAGRERTVTAAWEAELLRVIELDPHEVGQDTANWSRLICGVSFPPTCQRCSRCCQARTSICKMRCRWPFT